MGREISRRAALSTVAMVPVLSGCQTQIESDKSTTTERTEDDNMPGSYALVTLDANDQVEEVHGEFFVDDASESNLDTDKMELRETGTEPSQNGEFRLDGGAVKVLSDSEVVNLSETGRWDEVDSETLTPEDSYVGIDLESVSTAKLGNAPTVYVSQYASVQNAVDDVGDGKLIIDETVEENGITFTASNNGVTVEWIGNNWIDQPQSADLSGTSVFVEGDSGIDMRLINPRVRNPYLTDSDIERWDTIPSAGDRSGFLNAWTGELEVYGGHIHHLNGYGVYGRADIKVYGTTVEWVCYDGFRGYAADDIVFESVTSHRSGRSGIIADAEFGSARISGLVTEAYMTGVRAITTDITSTTHVNATIRNSTGWDGVGTDNHGANSTLQGTVSGNLNVINPTTETDSSDEEVVRVTGKADGLHVNIHSETQVDLTTKALWANLTGQGNQLTVTVNNVGNSDDAAVEIITGEMDNHNVTVRNSPGESVRVYRTKKSLLNIISESPGATGTDTAHVRLEGIGSGQALDNNIRLICEGANPDYAVQGDTDGYSDYNRIVGNIRNAFANTATDSLGANTDTSDLMM